MVNSICEDMTDICLWPAARAHELTTTAFRRGYDARGRSSITHHVPTIGCAVAIGALCSVLCGRVASQLPPVPQLAPVDNLIDLVFLATQEPNHVPVRGLQQRSNQAQRAR